MKLRSGSVVFRNPLRLSTVLLAGWLLLLPVGQAGRSLAQEGPGPGRPNPEQLLRNLAEKEGEAYWNAVAAIEALGKDALAVVDAGLKRPEAKVRMGCAKVAYTEFEKKTDAVATLISIIKEKAPAAQIAAAELLSSLVRDDYDYGDPDQLGEAILDILDSTSEARVKISVAKALYFVSASTASTRELKQLLESADSAIAEDAALALADMENFEAAMPVLKRLEQMPTPRGVIARLYIKQAKLIKYQENVQLPVGTATSKYDFSILEEMMDKIFSKYADPQNVSVDSLIQAAAHGIGGSLDRFSAYLDPKERLRLKEGIEMKYGGIGAHVGMRGGWMTIERPVYGGPVDKAGLRPLDQVREVEGVSTWGKDITEVTGTLRGDPGTAIRLKIYRRGWTEPRDFAIVRDKLSIDTAKGTLLPGKIGYVLLTSFGDSTAQELGRCLSALKDGGMTSLIVDVRNNPGGYLKAACEVVDHFLEADKIVVTTKDRKGATIETLYTERPDRLDLPTFVLVNGGSASAAEIFAGCMRDHKRGTLIGERTFGKGSVQNIDPLKSTGEKAAFRLTVHKYYLPGGSTPHKERKVDESGKEKEEGGIPPDPGMEVVLKPRDLWKDAEFSRILDAGELEDWWTRNGTANKELLRKIADFDDYEPAKYPGFDEFFASLHTKLERQDVREMLRQHVRRMVAWEYKIEMMADFEEDAQLQKAILEGLGRTRQDAASIVEYRAFAHAFDPVKTAGGDEGKNK